MVFYQIFLDKYVLIIISMNIESSQNSTLNNKLLLGSSAGLQTYKSHACPVKIIPDILQFKNIQINQKYQLKAIIRNEGKQSEKLRLILPITQYFTMKGQANPITIAPGLSIHLHVYFHLQGIQDCHSDNYQDRIIIIGNRFKKQLLLKASKPNFKLVVPKTYNLGLLRLGKQTKFTIPIKNMGKQDVQIAITQPPSPSICIEQPKFIIKKQSQFQLKVRVTCINAGLIEQLIHFPNGEYIKLKGVCSDQTIEIYNQNGKLFKSYNFGIVFIGEKIYHPYFIANNSNVKVEGLNKVLDKNVAEYTNFKIDLTKMTFINRNNPKKVIQQQKNVNIKCTSTKFVIQPFQYFENKLIIHKQPNKQELKLFDQITSKKQQQSIERDSSWNTLNEISQVLYIKFTHTQQPIKIPLQFSPIVPRISVSQTKFQFQQTYEKQTAKLNFTVHNLNERSITIQLENKNIFFFQGSMTIKPYQTNKFHICFRPLIAGQYLECLKLSLFDVWNVNIKAFGKCITNNNKSIKNIKQLKCNKQNTMLSPLAKSLATQQSRSNRYLSQQRKKRQQQKNMSYLKSKLTERTTMGFYKITDNPLDLAFDACQNPKVTSNRKLQINNDNHQGLYFNSQEYYRTLAQRKKTVPLTTNRLNIKQIVKFSQELTLAQLSKIQVRTERIDFGSVFVGSLTEKQFVLCNKNNKTILVEIDIGKNEWISQTKIQPKKAQPYKQVKFIIKLKPTHLGIIRIPICYTINRQHIFQIDLIANVTLINLGFSTNQLQFNFGQCDSSMQKVQSLTVTNFGTTPTKYVIIEPSNKAFSIISNKQQEVQPNSCSHISVKYKPLQGNELGQLRVDTDKLIVRILGGAENVIKLEGSVLQPKYSVKQTQINYPEAFISMIYQNKLTIRNLSKIQTSIKVEVTPSSLSQVINLDQKNFVLGSEQKKEVSFSVLSHDIKIAKGYFIISARGGKTYKIPIHINFCFPVVEVLGVSEVNLGTVHIMTNHFEREIILINKTKTQIKLQTDQQDSAKLDYIIQFIAAQQRVQMALRDTIRQSQQEQVIRQMKKRSICIEQRQIGSAQIKNTKNISKVINLLPGVQTKFKLKFVPKVVKNYSINIPLYLHKATRQIEVIPQKIKCKAVQPLFYVNPYAINFNNVIITQNQYAHKQQFQIINPHNREVDWQLSEEYSNVCSIIRFQEVSGKLNPKQIKRVILYFCPNKQGLYQQKIKLYSNLNKEILVELQITGNAVSPKISFNKNNLILPVVPIKTQSKGILFIQNYGYQAINISKAKFSHNFQGVDLRYDFVDGRLLSLAKKKIKIQIGFRSEMPISLTTNFEIFDEYGQKISIPVSATADNCILTTYPYLQTNNSTVVYDSLDNMLRLLVSKTFNSKNKQTTISGSSAVTGNFIKKWCNYQLNINMNSFPDSLIESKGQLLYQIIIKMTNGRPIVKKPAFTAEQKISKVLQLHQYYSQIIKALQTQGAFLNHIRPEILLNMNDYLIFMFHKGYIVEEDEQFQYISHDAWTALFYQLCKLYVQPIINEKMLQKFNFKNKYDKSMNSLIYSQSQISIISFINQYLGEQRIFSLSDQAKIFQAIQRILQKTFKISLSQQLTKLKINADSLMLHQFLILVSKFLYSHLQQFGLSMYLQPNDLFIMGYKQFILFFISLIQNLVHFQTYSVIQFQSASGQKSEKIIELENPSRKKKLRYWVKIYGSNNFKSNQKQIQIQPQETKYLRVGYHCKKNSSEQAQMVLVPIKGEDYFTPSHSLLFTIKNILISKTTMKRTNIKVGLYQIKTVSTEVELPVTQQSSQFQIKLIDSVILNGKSNSEAKVNSQYPNYYLIQTGKKTIRNGKDKLQLKIAPLELGEFTFKVLLISSTFQQYIYQYVINVNLPSVCQHFKLQPMTTQKQEICMIKIPYQNQFKQQCLKFHKQINKQIAKQKQKQNESKQKQKDKDKKITSIYAIPSKPKQKPDRSKYQLQFLQQSYFSLNSNILDLSLKQRQTTKNKWEDQTTRKKLEIKAFFSMPYRQYKSLLVVKNIQLSDYRVYQLSTSVSIKPKVFNMKLTGKGRQTLKLTIPNKMNPFSYRLQKNLSQLKIQATQSTQLLIIFKPKWILKQQLDIYVENTETLEQHIYKLKLEAKLPDPIKVIQLSTSQLFETNFQIDLSGIQLSNKEIQQLQIRSQLRRRHQISIKVEQKEASRKLVGKIFAGQQNEQSSIKLLIPKYQYYYQYILILKNNHVTDLGTFHMIESIGETRRLPLKDINPKSKNFHYEYESQHYLSHQFVAQAMNNTFMGNNNVHHKLERSLSLCYNISSNNSSFLESQPRENFCIVFKPIKQINIEKHYKFKSNSKQYIARVIFECKRFDPINIPVLMTENLDKKSTVIFVNNPYQIQGTYSIELQNSETFKVECHLLQLKSKQKAQIKINFIPRFIGETGKTKLTLKSQILPELSYLLQGISKFKIKQVLQQIQGYQGIEAEKTLSFVNQFSQKQRFKFEIVTSHSNPLPVTTLSVNSSFISSNVSDYIFQKNLTSFCRQIEPNQEFRFLIKNKCKKLQMQTKTMKETKVKQSSESYKKTQTSQTKHQQSPNKLIVPIIEVNKAKIRSNTKLNTIKPQTLRKIEQKKNTQDDEVRLSESENCQAKVIVVRLNNKKIVKQYILDLSIIRNIEDKKYSWQCKARQTIFQNIKLPHSYTLKQIKADHQIQKYISFNIDQKYQNEIKIKFSPLKPIKQNNFSILLICEKIKFRIVCKVKVSPPPIDDVITLRTSDIKQVGTTIFKLTNIIREQAPYKAYFQKNLSELHVQPAQGILQPYGKSGTPITIKFKSEVHNKKVQDRLVVETQSMYWIFKIIGAQEKLLKF